MYYFNLLIRPTYLDGALKLYANLDLQSYPNAQV